MFINLKADSDYYANSVKVGVGGKGVKKVDMLKSNWLPVFLMCFYVGIHEKSKKLNFFKIDSLLRENLTKVTKMTKKN